jgi:hypothetical protein
VVGFNLHATKAVANAASTMASSEKCSDFISIERHVIELLQNYLFCTNLHLQADSHSEKHATTGQLARQASRGRYLDATRTAAYHITGIPMLSRFVDNPEAFS